MKPTRLALPFALAASLFAAAHAAPTVNTAGGGTAVALAPEFTSGVQKMGLTLAPTFPARPARGGGGGGGGDDKPESLTLGIRGNICGIQIPDIPGYPLPEIPKEICDLLGGIFNPKLDSRLSITAEQGLRYRTGGGRKDITGVQFPIVTGEIDLQGNKGEITHAGGLTLKNDKTAVNLSSFVIDTTGEAPVMTGLVKVNDSLVGRMVVFDLTLKTSGSRAAAKPGGGQTGKLQLSAEMKLSEDAAAALNEVFGSTAFTAGIPVGAAALSSRTFDPDRGGGRDKPDGDKPDGDKPDGDKPDGKKRG